MKKIFISLVLLFSSVFGDCFKDYRDLYYYQGVSTIITFKDMIDEGKLSIDDFKDKENDVHTFSFGVLAIMKIIKEENLTTAEKYFINMNKNNLKIAGKDFFDGMENTSMLIKKNMDQNGYNYEQSKASLKSNVDRLVREKLRSMNYCNFY